ncbi:kinase-like protein [Rhizopogon salebrosus TDB-379]|nr:kinase-like protein [Rhizopogon salebrosus TDB-379]
MSGSTLSAAGTGSSVASRPEKRPLSPSSSPQPHRPRPSLSTEHPSRDLHSDIVETGLDDLKVQPTWEDFLRRTKLAATRPSESRLSAPYPRRYGDYLGTAIPSTSLSSSHFSSPNLTSPLIPDIKLQGTPTSTYVEAPLRDDWNSSNQNYAYPSNNTSLDTTNSPMPSAAPAPATPSSPAPSSTLALKRGKLPKETADYLKAWLHRHSDHPYPSEEEKKQLCHATGLTMSQVSNWMMNARRRILAPTHRAAQGPPTPAPYPSQREQRMQDRLKRRLLHAAELETEQEVKAVKRRRIEPSLPQESEVATRMEPLKLPQARSLLNASTSSNAETTATETGQGLTASYSLQDLTDRLRGKSNYPITSGGFGDIRKCELVKLNEIVQVAVKTIRNFESDNEALVRRNAKRVRRELKVWGRLKHECILPLWGVANDFGPYPAMICPWVDNGALTGFLERQQDTLSLEGKLSLLHDIALGLEYLHSKSIVHGDLTGSNVLVYGNGRACLADFGLSSMVMEFIGPSYLTSTIRGNIRWAAAELFEVPEDDVEEAISLSTECDVYSFGSITLQVLTCKVPYYNVRKDLVVLGQVIRGKKPEPPNESQIAPLHWGFIQRCWSPRASRPSVGEIVEFVASERLEV